MFELNVADRYALAVTKNLGLGCHYWPFPHHAFVLSGSDDVLFLLTYQIKLCVDIPVKIMII